MLKPEEIVGTCGQFVLYQRLIVEHSFSIMASSILSDLGFSSFVI
jgi:hypothetical protein